MAKKPKKDRLTKRAAPTGAARSRNVTYFDPINESQVEYVRAIRSHGVTLGLGPAGTGKTALAVSEAVRAYEKNEIDRIIITRPLVEAGERLGYLPGDIEQKMHPYLLPIYDILEGMLGKNRVECDMKNGNIEIAPFAYMRGRTFHRAAVIIDEAQNTTPLQIKTALTRLGEETFCIVTGDPAQSDIRRQVGTMNGLYYAELALGHLDSVGVVRFAQQDIVRSQLVAELVEAFTDYDVLHEAAD